MNRCINIDWLEVYALEDYIGYPHDADFFRRAGFFVKDREYGTRIYEQMFTIYDQYNEPFIEVRRKPLSMNGQGKDGILDPMACHIRLTNRACYLESCSKIMQLFLERYGFHYQRISRIDICLDFEKFDYGDIPADFIDRYFKGRYAKINQANISAHGTDRWNGRIWNSVSWGARKSMIGTKFYCKSLELEQAKDKPYIKQAWQKYGLIDDVLFCTKTKEDGTEYKPDIWRLEFSIKSGTRNWFVIERTDIRKKRLLSKRNSLDAYIKKEDITNIFFSLVEHYFHFKKYQAGVRKDRCEDKKLFNTTEISEFYKIENVSTTESNDSELAKLYRRLKLYQETQCGYEIYNAAEIILLRIEEQMRIGKLTYPWPKQELIKIRELLSRKIKKPKAEISKEIHSIEKIMKQGEIW